MITDFTGLTSVQRRTAQALNDLETCLRLPVPPIGLDRLQAAVDRVEAEIERLSGE